VGWNGFLATYMITRDFEMMKKAKLAEAQAEQEAIERANAQREAKKLADENVLATRAYLVELDEHIRRSLPDTFVRYQFRNQWHIWFIESKVSAGVYIAHDSKQRWYAFSPENQKVPLTLDNPQEFGRQIAAHIATALQPPTL
jgi:hypothetical protein